MSSNPEDPKDPVRVSEPTRTLFDCGRSAQMETFLDCFAAELYGRNRRVGECLCCGTEVNGREDFRDDISWREYQISYFCQSCQDETFGTHDEEEEQQMPDPDSIQVYEDVTAGHQNIVESAYGDGPIATPQPIDAEEETESDE